MMSDVEVTPSLWPKSLRPSVATPLSVLRKQASLLSRITNDRLQGDVVSGNLSSIDLQHHLDIIAPAIDYRHRVLTLTHNKLLVYPVLVESEHYRPNLAEAIRLPVGLLAGKREKPFNEAGSDSELESLIAKVLQAPEVESLLISLIALEGEHDQDRAQDDAATDSEHDPASPHPGSEQDEPGRE